MPISVFLLMLGSALLVAGLTIWGAVSAGPQAALSLIIVFLLALRLAYARWVK